MFKASLRRLLLAALVLLPATALPPEDPPLVRAENSVRVLK